ncbi:YoaK family protein [Sinosporangium siamense]|uniref:DUF1275 domain-containing protein n=1 Tax=Sinosporangium siamense TaxID=1367973 RepID=A0A919V6E4_9ACTN|nr:YoaK family protein [Sinosporangium siamense]GII91921.1 hypothetical protein Ssi02_21520 [Sinosporangium siamense]
MASDSGGASSVPTRHPLSILLITLTVVSGFVDATSYLGLGHVFTANMTGNVIIAGLATAGASEYSAVNSLLSLGVFIIGGIGAGRLRVFFRERSRVAWVRCALVAEASLTAAATVVAFVAEAATYVLIALLALAMGIRNGTVRALAVPDLPTTVITRTLAGLAAESPLGGGTNIRAGRRLLAVTAMFTGALTGAALLLTFGLAWPLLAATLVVTTAALLYHEPESPHPPPTTG